MLVKEAVNDFKATFRGKPSNDDIADFIADISHPKKGAAFFETPAGPNVCVFSFNAVSMLMYCTVRTGGERALFSRHLS